MRAHDQHVHAVEALRAKMQWWSGLAADSDHERRKRREHALHGIHAFVWEPGHSVQTCLLHNLLSSACSLRQVDVIAMRVE